MHHAETPLSSSEDNCESSSAFSQRLPGQFARPVSVSHCVSVPADKGMAIGSGSRRGGSDRVSEWCDRLTFLASGFARHTPTRDTPTPTQTHTFDATSLVSCRSIERKVEVLPDAGYSLNLSGFTPAPRPPTIAWTSSVLLHVKTLVVGGGISVLEEQACVHSQCEQCKYPLCWHGREWHI